MIFLEKLCFSLIVQNFQRFHFAFSTSNNETVIRNFEFLRKKYTFELGSELMEKGKMEEEYLEFLLNEHLKILDYEWLEHICYQHTMKDILQRLPNLTKISCFGYCNDAVLENIAKFCPKISEINASFSSVTDNGVKYLCKNENGACSELKTLFIFGSKVTEEGVENLIQNVPSLEKIYYKYVPQVLYSLHKEDLPKLANVRCYNLVELNLLKLSYLPYYPDILKISLTVCPKLKSIGCCISDKDQLKLFNNTNLEDLHLKCLTPNPEINLSNFLRSNGHNLVYLKASNCVISPFDLATSCPKLECLCIDYVSFTNNNNSEFEFRCLVKCDLQNIHDRWYSAYHDCTMDKAIRCLLLKSPNLQKLAIICCSLFSDTERQILKYCENHFLEEITFESLYIEMDYLKEILLSCPTLTTLNVEDCHCNYQDEKELIEFAQTLPNKPHIDVDGLVLHSDEYDYIRSW